jgi:hypothetical protein
MAIGMEARNYNGSPWAALAGIMGQSLQKERIRRIINLI